MPSVTAGQAIVSVLRAEGVKNIFGLPGGHVLAIYDALYHTPEIRHTLVRHEHSAASMAAAYAQLTGEPGVCLVTAGPGATNLVSGIAEAFVGALPIVILAGRGATTTTHRGASQEIPTERIFAPITKWAVRVDRADLVVDVLRQAFTIARSGKPGPVLVDLPRDLLPQQIEFDIAQYLPAGRPGRVAGDVSRIDAAVQQMRKARRPIVIAGGGAMASGAFDEVRQLAEAVGMPVLTSLSGRGCISDDHPLSVGGLGTHRNALSKAEFLEADFVLGLGTRFEEMETNYRTGFLPAPEQFYVQVDIDPAEIGKSVVPRIGIVGDIQLVVAKMLEILAQSGCRPEAGAYLQTPRVQALVKARQALESGIAEMLFDDRKPIHPVRAVMAIRKAFPPETIVAIDVGVLAQHIGGAYPYFKIFGPRSTIVCSSFYGMGFSAAALPAARLVHPDKPAVCLVGDGSFQMVMNVLPVAAEEKLGVTWCVLNDYALGSIRDIQEGNFDKRFMGTDFVVQPDFAKIAEACGCYGERVEDPAQITAALGRAREANSRGIPAVLDFIVSRDRVRGTLEFSPHYAARLK